MSPLNNENNSTDLTRKQATVLVVDDTPDNLSLMSGLLKDLYKVKVANNGEKALQIAASDTAPDLILLDIMMPGMDGYEVCRRLKEDAGTRDIPVIFLTAKAEVEDEARGLGLGAVDYITKPVSPPIVLARVRNHLELKTARDQLQAHSTQLEAKVRERTAELASLNTVYERFVPREFIDLLHKESILDIHLNDQVSQKMTVMFADIRNWTNTLEKMTPTEAFSFINAYLRRVTPVIKNSNGFIDQFYGDGVMALFPGAADDAVQAAVGMHQAVAEYNKERERDGFAPMSIGIGLHRAELMLGIIGSEDRLQGAVVGDAVNLAARIEGLNKMYGSYISLSDDTFLAMNDADRYRHRFIDRVRVKGKEDAVTIYEVFEGDPEGIASCKEQTKPAFEKGLELYYGKKFSEASVQFSQVQEKNPADLAAGIYLKRSATYMVNGVSPNWTGVETLTEK